MNHSLFFTVLPSVSVISLCQPTISALSGLNHQQFFVSPHFMGRLGSCFCSMRCWGSFLCQHSASGWAGTLALSAGASQLFIGVLCTTVSPPEPLVCSLSPAGAPGHPHNRATGLQASKAESSRPPKGQARDWHSVTAGQSHTEPPKFSWNLVAGVAGWRDCWPLSVETAPTVPVSVSPVWNHAAGLPQVPHVFIPK